MMQIQKAELMFFRPNVKGLLCFILLVLQSGCSDEVPKVVAKLGDEAKLPCRYPIRPGESMKNYKIYWQTSQEHGTLVANVYINGTTDDPYIDITYKNRTKMNEQNLTLTISSVKLSDEGTYECVILKDQVIKEPVDLSVVADFSKPKITAEKRSHVCEPAWLTLTCSSHGGYPRPKMFGSINNETVEWNSTATRDHNKLFLITGNLQHNMTEDIMVYCSVEYPGFKVSANLSLSIKDVCPQPLRTPYGIIIASAVLVIFVLTGVVLRCYCYSFKYLRSSRPNNSFQPVATADMAQQQLSNGTSGTVS